MRYGISAASLGEYAEPSRVVEVAQAAEAAGWEALLVWDHLAYVWGAPSADPWVVLGWALRSRRCHDAARRLWPARLPR